MPKQDVLKQYNLLQFHELVCALKSGNIAKFQQVMEQHKDFFISHRIFFDFAEIKNNRISQSLQAGKLPFYKPLKHYNQCYYYRQFD